MLAALRRAKIEEVGRHAMKAKGLLLAVALLLAAPAMAQISGQYLESRTADVYTGPCFANSEVNLTGREAVLA